MELFVFPLGHMLLYPSFSKPFHIYEPRYIQMVEDSIRTGTPIAIGNVFEIDESHEYRFGEPLNFVSQVVGFGMPVIVEKSAGSMVIFLEGKGKARLGDVLERPTPYIVCQAEKLSENHSIGMDKMTAFDVARKVMVHWMNEHIMDPHARDQFLNFVRTPEQVIGCYASYLVADHDLQQYILESNDINEKLDIIGRLIASGELVA